MTGLTSEQVLGKTDAEVFPAKIAAEHDMFDREVVETGRMLRRPGTVSQFSVPGHVIDVTKFPVRGAAGDIAVGMTILEDVTAQRRLEQQVLQAQKMEAIGRLAGGIAHDFNNLLQVVMGYGELLSADLTEETTKNDMERVLRAGRQAIGLVGQLLAISRQDRSQTAVVDIERLVNEVRPMLRRVLGDDVELIWKKTGTVPPAQADRQKVEQILLDLCINAKDAMPSGGSLTLCTSLEELDESQSLRHLDLEPGRYVVLSVADTGYGIPEELQNTIFEPFFTTKEVGAGSGLGLASAYAVVRSHGGSIEVDSRPGSGAVFTVRLPVATAEAVSAHMEPGRAASATGGNRLVLVAEDQDDVRNLCVAILRRAGFRVLAARDGVEALELLDGSAEDVELVILDVVMPRLDGRGVLAAIDARALKVPVIFCTGYDDHRLERNIHVDGAVDLLRKPYHPDQLLALVWSALGRRLPTDEAD